jgi:hypothetical protein
MNHKTKIYSRVVNLKLFIKRGVVYELNIRTEMRC